MQLTDTIERLRSLNQNTLYLLDYQNISLKIATRLLEGNVPLALLCKLQIINRDSLNANPLEKAFFHSRCSYKLFINKK